MFLLIDTPKKLLMSTLRSFTRISAFNLEGAWTGFSWMFFGRVICARQSWTMSHILSWAKSERSIMSISTCPQPLFRLLALWLFAKHQQGKRSVVRSWSSSGCFGTVRNVGMQDTLHRETQTHQTFMWTYRAQTRRFSGTLHILRYLS